MSASTTNDTRGVQRREQVFTAIVTYTQAHGYAPSIRDLMRMCGISSTANVNYHLNRLQKAGRIVRDPAVARSVRVVR